MKYMVEVIGEEEFKPLDESDVEEDLEKSGSSEATEDKEETENSEDDDESKDGATETETESEEKKDKEVEEKKVETPTQKVYFFNGRQLTADELYNESSLLNAEFTKKSQKLAELEKKVEPKEDILKDYEPEEVQRFDKLAKAMGFVKKEEIEKEQAENTQNSILKEFISSHPEYNDPANSNKLFETLKGYNTSLGYLSKSLAKAHEELNPTKPDGKEKSKVNEEKVARQSAGVSSGAKSKSSSSNYSPAQIDKMKEMGVWED